MKKFLLVAVAALAVVACKKDDDNNGGEQPTPPAPPAPQVQTPTTVPVGFVKKIEVTGQETSTTTFNVENNVLKGWSVVSPYATQTYTLAYEGKNLKKYTFESKRNSSTELFKVEYEFTYQNNKLVSFKRTRDNMSDIYDVVVDDKGRITSKTVRPSTNGWEGGMVWTATFTYTENSLVVKDRDGSTYTYTYQNENPTALATPHGNFSYSYDTTVLNDLNFEYFRLTSIVELFTRHSNVSLGGDNDVFVKSSKNLLTSGGMFVYEVTEKQGTNKPKTVLKKYAGGGNYATIRYTY